MLGQAVKSHTSHIAGRMWSAGGFVLAQRVLSSARVVKSACLFTRRVQYHVEILFTTSLPLSMTLNILISSKDSRLIQRIESTRCQGFKEGSDLVPTRVIVVSTHSAKIHLNHHPRLHHQAAYPTTLSAPNQA